MRLFSLLLLLCLPLSTHAISLKVEARAQNEQQAKREALAALADSILVEVKSEVSSTIKGSGERQEEHRISSRSDIPLIGADLSCVSLGREVLCEASLDSNKSLSLYTLKLEELRLEIVGLDTRLKNIQTNSRYPLLEQLLTLADQYYKYRAVSQLLGATQIPSAPHTRAEILEQMQVLEKLSPTLDIAAQVITKNLKADQLYIYPAFPQGSHEVTAFSRVMRDKLAQYLKPVANPENAKRFLKGEYEILGNGIHLTYRMLDDSGNTLETRIATLMPAAYQGMQVKPSTLDFDRLLHEGVVQGNDFKAQINSNRGSEGLLFDEKDEVELFVKLNRPGYFYIVGYVVKKQENYSYLLELSNSERDRRFIRYANADDVNKWLSIGRFEATAPYGIESLQLVASSDDPINRLPGHPQDSATGLYITAKNAQQGIVNTRALKPKRTDADKLYQAEAVLMFTTMPNNVKPK